MFVFLILVSEGCHKSLAIVISYDRYWRGHGHFMHTRPGHWTSYYLNLAPTIYCGLKRLVFKTRFMILILTI
jgi:hypothetical protein